MFGKECNSRQVRPFERVTPLSFANTLVMLRTHEQPSDDAHLVAFHEQPNTTRARAIIII